MYQDPEGIWHVQRRWSDPKRFHGAQHDEKDHAGKGGGSGESSEPGRSGGAATAERPTSAPHPNMEDKNHDGVQDGSRVGVPANATPPPPKLTPLPNLRPDERKVEQEFNEAFQRDPEGMARTYLEQVRAGHLGDAPNIFNTDDAKMLSPGYNPDGSDGERKAAMGSYNVVVHQTANAIAKRAFQMHLDDLAKLPEGDPKRTVLVTSGGVASGKGYVTKAMADKAGAVWDSAGEQNATENPWVHDEIKKRGLDVAYAYVHADPTDTWENPQRGVVERAGKKGRMVDARLFADSYEFGAKNFEAFAKQHQKEDGVEFFYFDNSHKNTDGSPGEPTRSSGIPREALGVDSNRLYAKSVTALETRAKTPPPLPESVLRGGLIGLRLWP